VGEDGRAGVKKKRDEISLNKTRWRFSQSKRLQATPLLKEGLPEDGSTHLPKIVTRNPIMGLMGIGRRLRYRRPRREGNTGRFMSSEKAKRVMVRKIGATDLQLMEKGKAPAEARVGPNVDEGPGHSRRVNSGTGIYTSIL